MRKFFTRAVVVCTFALTTVGGSISAHAVNQYGTNATPGNMSSHGWPTNGCTAVADSGTYNGARFDFYHACIHHDGCYYYHWGTKGECDQWFQNDMYASCRYLGSGEGCYQNARRYHKGVYYFGNPFYNGWSVNAEMLCRNRC